MFKQENTPLYKSVNCKTEVLAYIKEANTSDYHGYFTLNFASKYQIRSTQSVTINELTDCLFNFSTSVQLHFYYGIDLDQFAPVYQFDILRNLYEYRDRIDKRLDHLETDIDDYLLLVKEAVAGTVLDARQNKLKEKLEQKFVKFWQEYRKVVSVIGGFYMFDHFDDFLPQMIKKYKLCAKRYKIFRKISKLNDQLLTCYDLDNNLIKNKSKLAKRLSFQADKLQSVIVSYDRQIREYDLYLEDLRAEYLDEPAFQMHEQYRDQGLCLNYLTSKENKLLKSELVLLVPTNKQTIETKQVDDVLAEIKSLQDAFDNDSNKHLLYQSEIQQVYDLLAKLSILNDLKAQSLLVKHNFFISNQRLTKQLFLHRPKLLLWHDSKANSMIELNEAWQFLINLLMQEEHLTNVLVVDDFTNHDQISNCLTIELDQQLKQILEVSAYVEDSNEQDQVIDNTASCDAISTKKEAIEQQDNVQITDNITTEDLAIECPNIDNYMTDKPQREDLATITVEEEK